MGCIESEEPMPDERMSNRAALVIAAEIMILKGFPAAERDIQSVLQCMATAPPQPPGEMTVRIAVACDRSSHYCCQIDEDISETDALHECEINLRRITHRAIVTVTVPPIAIPVVEGKVE